MLLFVRFIFLEGGGSAESHAVSVRLLCMRFAPVHATLDLILLVAVFVCVVPNVQPVPSGLRYSVTGSLCSGLPML